MSQLVVYNPAKIATRGKNAGKLVEKRKRTRSPVKRAGKYIPISTMRGDEQPARRQLAHPGLRMNGTVELTNPARINYMANHKLFKGKVQSLKRPRVVFHKATGADCGDGWVPALQKSTGNMSCIKARSAKKQKTTKSVTQGEKGRRKGKSTGGKITHLDAATNAYEKHHAEFKSANGYKEQYRVFAKMSTFARTLVDRTLGSLQGQDAGEAGREILVGIWNRFAKKVQTESGGMNQSLVKEALISAVKNSISKNPIKHARKVRSPAHKKGKVMERDASGRATVIAGNMNYHRKA